MADSVGSARAVQAKSRVIRAALDSIVHHGVAGTSMRVVAEQAGVSVGLIAYYFSDKDGLLVAAFSHFTELSTKEFADFYVGVDCFESARAATVEMLRHSATNRSSLILGSELYNLSLRRPRHRMVLKLWTAECRNTMGQYFDSATTLLLDALYEGVLLHRSMELGEYTDEHFQTAVERIAPADSYIGPGINNA